MLTKIYLCPSDKKHACSWEGLSEDILDHFNHEHEDLVCFSNVIIINLSTLPENRLLFFDDEIYLLQTKIIDDDLCTCLRYLGPSKIAEKINFDIGFESNGRCLDKHNFQIKNGHFSVSLECIRTYFNDDNFINCVVLISGDFKSTGSEKGSVVTKEDNEIETGNLENLDLKPKLKRHPSFFSNEENNGSLTKLFSMCTDSPTSKTPEEVKTIWYDDAERSYKEHNLQRSFTYGANERKSNVIQRHLTNLSSITETDLDKYVKCTNCDDHLASPIFLCQSGHNICEYCYRHREFCNICNKNLTADRNTELEAKFIGQIYSCKNKKNGCSISRPYQYIQQHETECCFCMYLCPMDACGYKSIYKSMVTHLNLIHSSVKTLESFIAVFSKNNELFLVNERMGIFYCCLNITEEKVTWKAKYCGPKKRKFFCELKFKRRQFSHPMLLQKFEDSYIIEISVQEMKEQKLKSKHSILTITR